ncbi:hypothetical protein CRENBAI_016795 [Crenichthys baileyi]|uniref:Uncharacterized protein n=1 Tax=Crenichthys baileyi TaxID=28760 RepID=A0AAV9SHP7_9TELE
MEAGRTIAPMSRRQRQIEEPRRPIGTRGGRRAKRGEARRVLREGSPLEKWAGIRDNYRERGRRME